MKMRTKFAGSKLLQLVPSLMFVAALSNTANAEFTYPNETDPDVPWVFNSYSRHSEPASILTSTANMFELRIHISEASYTQLSAIRSYNQQDTANKAGNSGSGMIGSASSVNNQTYISDDYTIKFTDPSLFTVTRKNALTIPPLFTSVPVLVDQPYTSGAPIEFNGISTSITGAPATNAQFTVKTSKDAKVTGKVELVCNGAMPACGGAVIKEWQNVKIKLKGAGGSFRPTDGKSGFKVDFSESPQGYFPKGSASSGSNQLRLKKLTLNNMVGDNSRTHQVFSYDMYRNVGVQAPRTGFAQVKLYIQPTVGPEYVKDYGFYLNVETYDDIALPTTKHLYEGVYGNDVEVYSDVEKFDYDDFGASPDKTRADLTALVTANNTAPEGWLAAVQAKADLAQMVKVWAVSSYIRDQDGYASHGNNYYLAADATGKFIMLPWGTDATYDYDREAAWWTAADFAYVPRHSLLRNCLANETCFNMYHDALNVVRADAMATNYAVKNDILFNVIAPFINADPRQEIGLLDVIAGKNSTEQFMNMRIDQMDQYWVSGCCDHRDEDQDGVDNIHDRYPRISTVGYGDQDGDGAPSTCNSACIAAGMEIDNCPDEPNIYQKDQDNDGLGNACDVDIAIPNDNAFTDLDKQEIYKCCSKIISVNTVGQPWAISGRVLKPEFEFQQDDMR